MSVESKLESIIYSSLDEIQICSESEYERTTKGAVMLIDKFNDMQRLELEKQKVEVDLEKLDFEKEKALNEKHDNKIKNIISGAGVAVTVFGTIAMFIFEERGTITTQVGRQILNRIFRR